MPAVRSKKTSRSTRAARASPVSGPSMVPTVKVSETALAMLDHPIVKKKAPSLNVCKVCKRRYRYRERLVLHMDRRHPETKSFKCLWPGCENLTIQRCGLEVHLKWHLRVKDKFCHHCIYATHDPATMHRHRARRGHHDYIIPVVQDSYTPRKVSELFIPASLSQETREQLSDFDLLKYYEVLLTESKKGPLYVSNSFTLLYPQPSFGPNSPSSSQSSVASPSCSSSSPVLSTEDKTLMPLFREGQALSGADSFLDCNPSLVPQPITLPSLPHIKAEPASPPSSFSDDVSAIATSFSSVDLNSFLPSLESLAPSSTVPVSNSFDDLFGTADAFGSLPAPSGATGFDFDFRLPSDEFSTKGLDLDPAVFDAAFAATAAEFAACQAATTTPANFGSLNDFSFYNSFDSSASFYPSNSSSYLPFDNSNVNMNLDLSIPSFPEMNYF
ncbi:hypothetical protein ABKN59_011351 [Abortiporus biennis]